MTARNVGATSVAVAGTAVVSAGPCLLIGYSLRSTAVASSNYFIWDNASGASGTKLASLTLVQNQFVTVTFPVPVMALAGIYLESGGTIEGAVFIMPNFD